MKTFRTKVPKEDQEVTARFMLDEAPAYHKALVQIPLLDDVSSSALRDLEEVLEAYNATVGEKGEINLQNCTFDEVLKELDRQRIKYDDKAKGLLNIGRYGLRRAGDHSASFSPWVDLIPSTMGLSFLNAGLKIILSIAKQNADNREKIFNAFHDITHIILDTKVRQDQFASVQLLRKAAIALYTTLVKALAELIYLLHGNRPESQFKDRVKRMGQKLLNPSAQGKVIDDILSAVERSSAEFRSCLDMVNSQISIETHRNTKSLISKAASIQKRTGRMVATLDKVSGGMNELQDRSRFTDVKIDRLVEQFQAEMAELYRNHQEAMEGMMRFFLSDMPKWWASSPVISRVMTDPGIHTFLSVAQLFRCLDVSPSSLIKDVEFVLQQLGRLDSATQAQAQQLLSTPEFFDWIEASKANTLYVQGNFRVATPGRISAMSALCATLSLGFSKNTDCIVLLFLCELHEAPDDPIAGPNGLIRSLIVQLLLTGRNFKLDFINTRDFSEQIQFHNLPALTHTFRQIIEQLPTDVMVICIIDGLVRFEPAAWLFDLVEVIQTLNQVIHNPDLYPVVKLLVTTQFANSQHVGRLIQAHQAVTLRPAVAHGGHRIAERSVIESRNRLQEYRLEMQRRRNSEDESYEYSNRGFGEDNSSDDVDDFDDFDDYV